MPALGNVTRAFQRSDLYLVSKVRWCIAVRKRKL